MDFGFFIAPLQEGGKVVDLMKVLREKLAKQAKDDIGVTSQPRVSMQMKSG